MDNIDRSTRLVSLHGDSGQVLTVYVDPAVAEFDSLHEGDAVTVRYVESTVVRLRPGATPSDAQDTTADAKKAGQANVIEQQRAVVTIEDIDPDGQSVTYRTAAGLKMMRVVTDKRLLDGLHSGDRVEVTLTRERAISITRGR